MSDPPKPAADSWTRAHPVRAGGDAPRPAKVPPAAPPVAPPAVAPARAAAPALPEGPPLLNRVAGILLLAATLGVASCQAMLISMR